MVSVAVLPESSQMQEEHVDDIVLFPLPTWMMVVLFLLRVTGGGGPGGGGGGCCELLWW